MTDISLIRQLAMFGAVGALATATHYIAALAAHEGGGASLLVANTIGFLCAVGVSYFGHGKLTFRASLNGRRFVRFFAVALGALLLSQTVLAGLQTTPLPARIALAIGAIVVPAISFVLGKWWVYRDLAKNASTR